MAQRFFTIGHSTRSIAEFVELLRESRVERIVDVRSMPRSRTNPQFNGPSLAQSLAGRQIGYEHIAELGGLRGKQHTVAPSLNAYWRVRSFRNYADYALSEPFAAGLARLRRLGARHRCAIMCAETLWWRCHRRLIADVASLTRGLEVRHLMHTGQPVAHRPAAGARVRHDGLVVWDAAPSSR
jgi:uncharacterized protein (DUF488 family)